MQEIKVLVSIFGEDMVKEYPWKGSTRPTTDDNIEGVLRRPWDPTLSIVGSDGLPPIENAGNVLRPFTVLKLSIRIPPMVDALKARSAIHRELTGNVP